MKMFKLFIVSLFIVASPTISNADPMPLENGTILYNKVFEEWSVIVTRFNQDVLFRAGTIAENDNATLLISFSANNCDAYYNELVADSGNINKNDINSSMEVPIASRVDSKAILKGNVIAALGNLGETNVHYMMNFHKSSLTFIENLIDGSKLRIKVGLQEPVYIRFSLKGSNIAIKQAQGLCYKFIQNVEMRNDKNFFKDNTGDNTQEKNIKKNSSEMNNEKYFRDL